MTNLDIKKIFEGITTDLKPSSSLGSFGYGLFHEINATSERPYPLLWLESDMSFLGSVTPDDRQTQDVKFAIDLLDQVSIQPEAPEFADHIAKIKTKLMATWQTIFSALVEVNNTSSDWWIEGGYNALPLDRVKNDWLYGYRFELTIKQIVTPNDCAFVELTGKTIQDYLTCA